MLMTYRTCVGVGSGFARTTPVYVTDDADVGRHLALSHVHADKLMLTIADDGDFPVDLTADREHRLRILVLNLGLAG